MKALIQDGIHYQNTLLARLSSLGFFSLSKHEEKTNVGGKIFGNT